MMAQLPADTSGLHLAAYFYGGFAALSLAKASALPIRSLWVCEPVMFGALRPVLSGLPPEVVAEVEALYDQGNAMLDKAKQLTRAVSWKMFKEVWMISHEPEAFAQYTFEGTGHMGIITHHRQGGRQPGAALAARGLIRAGRGGRALAWRNTPAWCCTFVHRRGAAPPRGVPAPDWWPGRSTGSWGCCRR